MDPFLSAARMVLLAGCQTHCAKYNKCIIFICAKTLAGRHRAPHFMEEVAAQIMISGACWNHTTSSADRIGTKPACLTLSLLLVSAWLSYVCLTLGTVTPWENDWIKGPWDSHRRNVVVNKRAGETELERGLRWGELPQQGESVSGKTQPVGPVRCTI